MEDRMSALLDTAYAQVYPERHADCLRNEMQGLADVIKAKHVAQIAATPAPAVPAGGFRYSTTGNYGMSCVRCGGTPDGQSHRGFVGRCTCGVAQ